MPPIPMMKTPPLRKAVVMPQFIVDIGGPAPSIRGATLGECSAQLSEDGQIALAGAFSADKLSPGGGSALWLGTSGRDAPCCGSTRPAPGFAGDKFDK